jgi:hypothetical protein
MNIEDEVRSLLATDNLDQRAQNLLEVFMWAVDLLKEYPDTKFMVIGDGEDYHAVRSTNNTSFRDLIYMLEQSKMVLMTDGVKNVNGAINVTVDMYLGESE